MAKKPQKPTVRKPKRKRRRSRRADSHEEAEAQFAHTPISPATATSLQRLIGNSGTKRAIEGASAGVAIPIQAKRQLDAEADAEKAGVNVAYATGKAPKDDDTTSAALTIAEVATSIVAEVAPFIVGAIATVGASVLSTVSLLKTISDANERQQYSGKLLGTKLGLSVLGWMPSGKPIPDEITSRYLEAQVKQRSDLLHQWTSQIQYAGISGPALVTAAMREGLAVVAAETTSAFQQADAKAQQYLQVRYSPEEAQARLNKTIDAVRRQVCQQIFEIGFQRLNSSFESTDEKYVAQSDPSKKIAMINGLLDGWVSDKDLAAIRRICASNPEELPAIRAAIEPRVTELVSMRQRMLLRRILDGS